MNTKAMISGLMLIASLSTSVVCWSEEQPQGQQNKFPAKIEGRKNALKMVKELKLNQAQFNLLESLCTQEVKAKRSMMEKIEKLSAQRTEGGNTSYAVEARQPRQARQNKAQRQESVPINQEYLRPGTVVAPTAETSRVINHGRNGSPSLIIPSTASPANQVAIASTLNQYSSVASVYTNQKGGKVRASRGNANNSIDERIEKIKSDFAKGHTKRVSKLEDILTETQYNKWIAEHPEGLL